MWWNKEHSQDFVIHAPYPSHLPNNVLTWGRIYDIEEWRAWYAKVGFNIEDVYETEFHGNGTCTILTYKQTKAEGRPFLSLTPAAFDDPITIRYPIPPPAYT